MNTATESNLKQCHCCHKETECNWNQQGNYWICEPCQTKIIQRQKRQSTPATNHPFVSIDKTSLTWLRLAKLIPTRLYVYFALQIHLKLTHQKAESQIPIKEFCDEWMIDQSELLSAIGSLSKKGLVDISSESITLKPITLEEKITQLKTFTHTIKG